MDKKFLITGCGGDLGFGIGKVLKNEGYKVFGSDLHDFHPGKYIFEKCFIVPYVKEEKRYLTEITSIVREYEIDIIIPASEPEIMFFQDNEILDINVLMCSNKAHITFRDKYLTNLFLKNNNLPHPLTIKITENILPNKYPVILKNSQGSGSASVYKINDKEMYEYYKKKLSSGYIQQEYIEGDEYTCCIFRSKNKEIRTIIMRRELGNGISIRGEVINDDKIKTILESIANVIDLNGSINVQLRVCNNIPFIFEINPRFSSTIVSRHLLGYKDIIWSINDFLGLPLSEYHIPEQGKRFCVLPQQFII